MSRVGYKPEDGTNGKLINMLKKELHELRVKVKNLEKQQELDSGIGSNSMLNERIQRVEQKLDILFDLVHSHHP
jgi:hypothetical protein